MNTWFQRSDRRLLVGVGLALLLVVSALLFTWGPTRERIMALAKPDLGLRLTIAVHQGQAQMVATNKVFAQPLEAAVTNSSGKPVGGVTVFFSAPASGPSGSFAGVANTSVLSDDAGIAVAPPLTANALDGSYTVIASIPSVENPAYFSLINTSTPASSDTSSGSELKQNLRFNVLAIEALCLLAALYFLFNRFTGPGRADLIFSMLATTGISVSIFTVLATFARDDYFAPLETLMINPRSLPIYGQRLLLVWLADAIKLLMPALSYRRCYLATQFVAIFAANFMIGQWAAAVVGRQWRIVSQLLLAAMLIPTITYGTFYDIPMICVYSACLYFLYKRQYFAFVGTLGIGTLNHENTLLLVPASALILWGLAPRKIAWGVPMAGFAIWAAIRFTMQTLIPEPSHFDPRLWSNLTSLSHPSAELIKSLMSLVFWWSCAAIGFRSADRFARRAAIVLPALVAVTFLAGRFVEARQFDAFIPIAIALILSHLNRMAGTPRAERSDDSLAWETKQDLADLQFSSVQAGRTVQIYKRGL